MSKSYFRDYYYYPPSKPKDVKGGIKAKSQKGAFGESWWAKRWIETLESFNIGARLSRGKSYARKGQVTAIEIEKGRILAKVQGSRSSPYKVEIKVKPLSEADWKKVAKVFSSQAIFAAKLLSGEMPEEIEEAFKQARLSLFPQKHSDLETSCSCPDWSNPCKHIAAVYYLLGEEFDRDPFLIFRLRGLTREELMELLGSFSPASVAVQSSRSAIEEESSPPEELSVEPNRFWGDYNLQDPACGVPAAPTAAAALLKRLGGLPFWRGERDLFASLEPVYREASRKGMDILAGE